MNAMASLRRLMLVLLAMLVRPWIWLMLAVWVLWPVLSALSNVMSPPAQLMPVAVVSGPAVPPNGGADVREDRLATITDWHALWARVFVAAPGGGYTLVEADRDRSERLGDWDILDRLPAIERLWMTAPDVLSEAGWQRIGDRARLKLLSLQNVGTCYAVGDDGFARDGRDALARLTRLQHLELRGTGPDVGVLLPPLPALEACGIGWRHLEENLRALSVGSPRLHSLALDTYPEFEFTPGMLAALRQMPALRTVFIDAAARPDDEPAMARQVAEVGRAVTQVRVRPGSYSAKRVAAVGSGTLALAGICWAFWFQAATLLATPLAWMLPRRFPPHAVWPTAVATAGGAAFFFLCQSFGVAWLPALGLALFACGVGLYGPVFDDTSGWPARLTWLAIGADYAGGLLIGGFFLGAAAMADRWLMGYEPAAALALVVGAAASLGWKIARVARLPRILAEGGREAALMWRMAGGQAAAWAPTARTGHADRRWWRPDVAIDRQLARPLPTATSAAAAFADMLRRPQSRLQILTMVGFMLGAGIVISVLPGILRGSDTASWPPTKGWAAIVAVQFAWQAAAISLSMTAAMWWQRRDSLALDFLRPVSRRDYWLGLCGAITRDLIVPLAVVAAGLVMAASWWGQGRLLPWLVSALGFGGLVATTHAMLLRGVTDRRPLIAATIAGIVFIAVAVGLAAAVGEAFLHVWYGGAIRWWRASLGAILLLAVGLVIRVAVLRQLEDREIG
jgi:hypothetical protein